jgi:curved DNA-binding protein CbpA
MSECDTMTQTKTQIEVAARVLGVAPNAGMPAIKQAYRMQLKRHHPDMVKASNGVASSRFSEILDAFAILSDPHLLAEHDRLLAEQRQAAKAAAPLRPEPPASRGTLMARGAFAAVILGCWGFMAALAALLLAILVGVAGGIIK